MAFTVDDFQDLIRLLGEHPEWQEGLRRHVLSDELLELPAVVRQLSEAQSRTEQRLIELAEAQSRTEQRLIELSDAQSRTEQQLKELATAQSRTESRLDALIAQIAGLAGKVGGLEGEMLELRYERRAPTYFGSMILRLRVVESQQLAELLDTAIADGRLTEEERHEVLLADLVLSGRTRQDPADVYLLAEISAGIGPDDVRRALERGRLLKKLGRPVLPTVAGHWISPDADEMARGTGVLQVLNGSARPPLVVGPSTPQA